MKNFIKLVLANIVATFVLGGVFILALIMLIFAYKFFVSDSSSNIAIKENTILKLNINEQIIESSTEIVPNIHNFLDDKNIKLSSLLMAIETAKNDEKIKGISIETDNISAGYTQLDDIRKALEDFKKSGKFVYAYGNNISQSSYYLSSVADRYYLHPAGGIELKGLNAEILFLKDFLDKYGIGVDVIRYGKFKAAVEPFISNKISKENETQLSYMLGDIWKNISNKIEKSRNISKKESKKIVDSLYGVIPKFALENKLIDGLLQKLEYDNILKNKINISENNEPNYMSIKKYITYIEKNAKSPIQENKIAVLYASGEIYSGKGSGGIYSEDFIKEIRKISENNDIKAVVLRVNSPGGSANASDEILFELRELKNKKPLVVSFGDYAASGGYYISMAGDKIFCEANTITGSIGVFGLAVNLKELANKNGIRTDVVSTNANSNMYSISSGFSSGTKDILQKSVDMSYKRFVYFVSENRQKTFEEIDNIGQGRVWSGIRAKEIGLVDEIGSLQDAIKYASELSKTKDFSIIEYPKNKKPIEMLLESLSEDNLATKAIEKKLGKESSQLLKVMSRYNNVWDTRMEMPFTLKIR